MEVTTPSRRHSLMSRARFEGVRTIIGISCVRLSALTARTTSSPLFFGRLRSRRMIWARWVAARSAYEPVAKMKSSASAPSRTTCTGLVMRAFFNSRSVNWASCGLSSTRRISTVWVVSLPVARSKSTATEIVPRQTAPEARRNKARRPKVPARAPVSRRSRATDCVRLSPHRTRRCDEDPRGMPTPLAKYARPFFQF